MTTPPPINMSTFYAAAEANRVQFSSSNVKVNQGSLVAVAPGVGRAVGGTASTIVPANATAAQWVKLATFPLASYPQAGKTTFNVRGLVGQAHVTHKIDVAITTNNVSSTMIAFVNQESIYQGGSSAFWGNGNMFDLVAVYDSSTTDPSTVLYAVCNTGAVPMTLALEITCLDKNAYSSQPVFYADSHVYSLAFNGIMTSATDPALGTSLAQYAVSACADFVRVVGTDGFTGIGTNDPRSALDVAGAVTVRNGLDVTGDVDVTGALSATGTVTAPTFVGALSGNAATATTSALLSTTSTNSQGSSAGSGGCAFVIPGPSSGSTFVGYISSPFGWGSTPNFLFTRGTPISQISQSGFTTWYVADGSISYDGTNFYATGQNLPTTGGFFVNINYVTAPVASSCLGNAATATNFQGTPNVSVGTLSVSGTANISLENQVNLGGTKIYSSGLGSAGSYIHMSGMNGNYNYISGSSGHWGLWSQSTRVMDIYPGGFEVFGTATLNAGLVVNNNASTFSVGAGRGPKEIVLLKSGDQKVWFANNVIATNWNTLVGDGDNVLVFSGSDGLVQSSANKTNFCIVPWQGGSAAGLKICGHTGHVGIGTANPTRALDVAGDVGATGTVSASHVSTATLTASGNVNVNGKLIVGTDGASQNGLYFAGTANDGTNHSVILNRLYDSGGGAGQSVDYSEILLFQANDANNGNGQADRIRSVAGAHQWQIYTASIGTTDTATSWGENNYVTAMYIAPVTGNVGINTKTPAHTLDVNGTLRSTGNVTAPTFVGALSGNATSATTSASCSGNAATSSSCTGNAASATVANGLQGTPNITVGDVTSSGTMTINNANLANFSASGNGTVNGNLTASNVLAPAGVMNLVSRGENITLSTAPVTSPSSAASNMIVQIGADNYYSTGWWYGVGYLKGVVIKPADTYGVSLATTTYGPDTWICGGNITSYGNNGSIGESPIGGSVRLHPGQGHSTAFGNTGRGTVVSHGEFTPSADNTYSCGSTSLRWQKVHAVTVHGSYVTPTAINTGFVGTVDYPWSQVHSTNGYFGGRDGARGFVEVGGSKMGYPFGSGQSIRMGMLDGADYHQDGYITTTRSGVSGSSRMHLQIHGNDVLYLSESGAAVTGTLSTTVDVTIGRDLIVDGSVVVSGQSLSVLGGAVIQGLLHASEITTSGDLSCDGNLSCIGNLSVGNTGSAQNGLYFAGASGDPVNHTVILNRNYDPSGGATPTADYSEMLLFQGNDVQSGVGPDRIRCVAGAHMWQVLQNNVGISDTNTFWADNNFTTAMYIAPYTGFVGIATKSPAYTLDVNGNIHSRGAITATGDITGLSDRRVKENIERIADPLDKIDRINGYTFTRNDDDTPDVRHAGVVAQEVLEVLPEVIRETPEGMLSVAYGNIVALLIEGIKELRAEVKGLKAEIKDLRAGASSA